MNWSETRKAVLERDQYRCQDCGRRVSKATAHIHHIKHYRELSRDEKADDPTNLLTLCHSCHQEIHRNRDEYSQIYSQREVDLLLAMASTGSGLFTVKDAEEILNVGRSKSGQMLYKLAKKGVIERLERNLYRMSSPFYANPMTHSSFVIASYLIEPYSISYWSALNFWNFTEQIPLTVFVQSTSRKYLAQGNTKQVGGIPYRFITVDAKKFFGWHKEEFDSCQIRIGDREKTIADCLDRPDLCGGIIEAAKGLWYGYRDGDVDLDKLTDYAERMGNMAIVKRLGFLAESMEFDLGPLYNRWRSMLTQGFSLLDPTLPREGRYTRRWRIIVNLDKSMLLSWRQS